MRGDWRSKFWRTAAQCLSGGIGLALVAFVYFRLGLRPATAGFAYLILSALLARMGTVFRSVVLSAAAGGCLQCFLAPAIFDFRVDAPEDVLAIAAFLTTSITAAGLTAKVRKMADEAQASQKALVDTIPSLGEPVIRTHQNEAHQVLVTVEDCGVGISAEDADRLFNAFFTTKSSGIGMRLSICGSIIEAHGGRVWAAPNLPQGASFHFAVPLHQGAAS